MSSNSGEVMLLRFRWVAGAPSACPSLAMAAGKLGDGNGGAVPHVELAGPQKGSEGGMLCHWFGPGMIGTATPGARRLIRGVEKHLARREKIVAVALLTDTDLERVGGSLKRVFPLDQGSDFSDLLAAIDDADSKSKEARPRAR